MDIFVAKSIPSTALQLGIVLLFTMDSQCLFDQKLNLFPIFKNPRVQGLTLVRPLVMSRQKTKKQIDPYRIGDTGD